MKKSLTFILFCSACNSTFVSGEYSVTYGDEIYGLGPASINADTSTEETTYAFDEYAGAEQCPTYYQSVARSESVRIDIDPPKITEIDNSSEGVFSLGSADCGTFPTPLDDFTCWYPEAVQLLEFEINGEVRSYEYEYSMSSSVRWYPKSKSAEGEMTLNFSEGYNDEDEEVAARLREEFDPTCQFILPFTLTLVE